MKNHRESPIIEMSGSNGTYHERVNWTLKSEIWHCKSCNTTWPGVGSECPFCHKKDSLECIRHPIPPDKKKAHRLFMYALLYGDKKARTKPLGHTFRLRQ